MFEPVRLCGTSVSRATLHNQDFIDQLDVGIGDYVKVYKSGEIIPKIREVLKDRREPGVRRYQLPDTCPGKRYGGYPLSVPVLSVTGRTAHY